MKTLIGILLIALGIYLATLTGGIALFGYKFIIVGLVLGIVGMIKTEEA